MNSEFQQYRCAPIEAQNITRARLEAEFKHRMADIKKLENAIARLIAAEPATCTPWRRSKIERLSCREGMQTAALEFYWAHRQILQNVTKDGIALQNE